MPETEPKGATYEEFMQLAQTVDGTALVIYNRELALSILIRLNEGNRRKKETNIEALAESMRSGEFKPDIQRIFVSKVQPDGGFRLFNGQHTLEAVSKANVNVPIETRFNAPDDYLKFIDIGAARSVADVGRIAYRMPYAAANTGVYRAFMNMLEGAKRQHRRVNAEEVQAFWLEHQEFLTMLHHSLNGKSSGLSIFTDDNNRPMKKVGGNIGNARVKSVLLLGHLHYPVQTRNYIEAFLCEEGRYWSGDAGPALAKRRLTGRDDTKSTAYSGVGRLNEKLIQHIMLKTLHMFIANEKAQRFKVGGDDEFMRYVNFFLQRPLDAPPLMQGESLQ